MTDTKLAPTPGNGYSFSRIKCLHQCPLRYRYRYLQGLKEAFRSIESYLGNAVHDVLEWLYAETSTEAGNLTNRRCSSRLAAGWNREFR